MILRAVTMSGCDSHNERLARYAEQATAQQARQNERIAEQSVAVARQSQELASAAHQLVEHDATARRELIDAHGKLQERNQIERSTLDHQRESLASEQKAFARGAVRDPVVARAIITAALALAALLPLLVTVYALRRLPEQSPADELLHDLLLDPLASDPDLTLPSGAERERLREVYCSRLDGRQDRLPSDEEG